MSVARAAAVLVLAAFGWSASCAPAAEGFPSRPVRLLIGLAPGGTQDFVARAATGPLAGMLGQSIVIDNRAGAGGTIAADIVARAAPDGHTLLHTSSALVINPHIYRKLPYDAYRDFEPLTIVARGVGYLLIVNSGVRAQSVKEFVALARNRDRPLAFGSAGIGNNTHLVGELFNLRAGASLMHVPYKGGAPAVTAVISGEIQAMFVPPTSVVMQQMKAGRLRVLAFTAASRWAQLPDVPTVAESGVPNFVSSGAWHGWLAPARTPRRILDAVQAGVHRAVHAPDVREALAQGGYEAVACTPEEFRRIMRAEGAEFGEAVKAAGIKPE